jgi:hypothetical protein
MTGRIDLISMMLAVIATAVGVWLGVAGADISPIFTEAPFQGAGGSGR